MSTSGLVAWATAPPWVTVDRAAALLGPAYDAAAVMTLIEIGAIDAEEDGAAWLVDVQSLADYREALAEVLSYEE